MGNTPTCPETGTPIQIRETLWAKAKKVVAKQETEEVCNILGKQTIEENERLFDELTGLVGILEDYQGETLEMVAKKNTVRKQFVGQQKLQLEATLRTMLDKAKDLQCLTPESSKLASHLMEAERVTRRDSIASSTPASFPFSTPDTTISTIVSYGSHEKDISEYKNQLSLRTIDDFDRLEMLRDELRDLLQAEKAMLTDDIDWVRSLLEEEITSRSRVLGYEEPDLPMLLGLKQELEGTDERREWSERLRRLPSSRKKLLDDGDEFTLASLRARGGCRGVFAAVANRCAGEVESPVMTPSPPPSLPHFSSSASPRSSRGSNNAARQPFDPVEDARDWLAVTQSLCTGSDEGKQTAIQLLEQQPRKHGATPSDRFDIGFDFSDSE